jgi:Fic-DOC domain mobile mystery protein B
MFDQTWQWAGKFRRKETNIGVAPENIQNEMGVLLGNVDYWLKSNTYELQEISVRFHHKLVWIHPFTNGNGRLSRLAADLLLVFNKCDKLSWGSVDLASETDSRCEYLKALRIADQTNDYGPLLKFARS